MTDVLEQESELKNMVKILSLVCLVAVLCYSVIIHVLATDGKKYVLRPQ